LHARPPFPPGLETCHRGHDPQAGKRPSQPPFISLLNIAGKVFEKILSTRLKNFLEINNLLPPEQFGFRSERSTINPILEFHTDTTRHANLKEHTLAVFLDIERDFDRVWHDGLVQKLIKIPINPNKPQFHPTHRLLSLKSYLQRQNSEHQGPAQSLFKQGSPRAPSFPPFSVLYTAEIFLLQMPPGRRPVSSPTTPPSGQARETP
jgi:hypothetical protein